MDYFCSLGQQKNLHVREILKHSLAPKQNNNKKRKNLKQSNCFVLPPYSIKPTACGEIAVLKDMIYLQAENPIDLAKNREYKMV